MTDDDGVLGNLPRSRPGRRSAKRAQAGAARAPKRRPAASAPRPAPERTSDPVGGALRTATGVAAAGARVANGVAREVLRRLPRP
jgi:hypothetical protein